MRASPRKRAPGAGSPVRAAACAGAVGLAVALGCAGWMAGAALAASSPQADAVAAAKRAAARAESRVATQNAVAGTVAAKPATAVKPAAGTKSTTAVKPAAPAKAVAVAKPATRAPQAGKPAVAGRGAVVATAASMRPAVGPVPSAAPPAVRLDDQVTYQYNALGRRDPFMPLVGGRQYVPIEAPPDIGGLQVVGIVWGAEDKFAIIEDSRGNSTVLRPGDKVMNGVVQGLKRDGVVVDLTVDGQTQSVTIPLTRKGEPNANR